MKIKWPDGKDQSDLTAEYSATIDGDTLEQVINDREQTLRELWRKIVTSLEVEAWPLCTEGPSRSDGEIAEGIDDLIPTRLIAMGGASHPPC